MKTSFIIVNYNRKDEVLLTISKTKQLTDFNKNSEIIVVDNASTDGSPEAIKVHFPEILLIENKINIGVPAWNEGFKQAKGEYFIVLDDDSNIDSGLDEAIAYLDQHQDIGVMALNIKGGAFQTDHWKDKKQYSGFIGCGAMLRKELYDKIGGYANWIFLYSNEYEYGIRCINAGYKIVYFKDCHVSHRTSSINRSSKRLITYSVRNEMAIVYKYFSKKHRTLFLTRVYLNNLRCVFIYGVRSIPWYISALIEFFRLKKELKHTPVRQEVEKFYSQDFWSTRRFLGMF